MGSRQFDLLEQDVAGIQTFLDEFDLAANGELRTVEINPTGELVIIRNMPLPDGFDPDHVDVLILTHDYPSRPPIGMYLLRKNNDDVISQLGDIFNVMGAAAYQAPTVAGYAWICVIYENNSWRFNAAHIAAGDNLRKFVIHFFNRCLSDSEGL